MSGEPPVKQLQDFSAEVKIKIPEIVNPVKNNPGRLQSALDDLLALEKKTRLAADARSTSEVALAILNLCYDNKAWSALNDQISAITKKRAQLQRVITAVVQEGMKFVDKLSDKALKLELLQTLRTVAAGKMFVELETARMTRTLVQMKEDEGKIAEAADILQEIQVETVGTMEAREKADFLLNQLRLCLAKRDYVRSEIVAKKVSTKTLAKDDLQDLKIKFHELMIQYYKHFGRYLDICKSYLEIYNTKSVQENPPQWKESLKRAVLYLVLSPYDAEVSEILNRLKVDKKILLLPASKALLEQFTTDELIKWPLLDEKEWKSDKVFEEEKGKDDKAKERWDDFHKRIVQHNIRVLAQFYGRITTVRFAHHLHLDVNKSEVFLSEMVSSKQLFAKIDRPGGIITFTKKLDANEVIHNWSNDIGSLLALVETTTHLINKENMTYAQTAALEEKSS